ncbi:hypothetical protein DFP72DRAFT_415600 [Ephemerocybe angulata]|uniref:DUF6534 domain-containing protein n=1 Tax=Ephemerocybe angulata TaxID=980116 RepID=A0A8H6MFJ9_9AGAR|nr:hypothetical protein DFP72DRAFT_415600 [Tulosesus angulatus]
MGEYDDILGTLLIGVTVNTYLYGVVSCQYTTYHNTNFDDKLCVKLAVLFLFTLDTAQSIFMIYLSWIFTVVNFSNPVVFSNTHWPCAFIPIGTAVTACVSHLFLGLRMYGISKNKALYAIVLAMTIAELAAGVAFGICMWIMDDPTLLYTLRPFIVSWLTIQMTIDIFVSCFMSCFFHRCRTGYRRTDTVINRLIRGCIQTGAFSAMLAICGLVAFIVRPHTILYAMFMIPIGRTYTTTLMDTLNVRFELKERLMEGIDPHAGNVPWGRRGGTTASAQGSRASAEGTQLSNLARKNAVDFPTFAVRDDASMDVYDTGIFKASRPRGEGGSGSVVSVDLRETPPQDLEAAYHRTTHHP